MKERMGKRKSKFVYCRNGKRRRKKEQKTERQRKRDIDKLQGWKERHIKRRTYLDRVRKKVTYKVRPTRKLLTLGR